MIERDVRDVACPGPVIELRKLLDAGTTDIKMLVGDELARSNVSRFAASRGAKIEDQPLEGGGFALTVHCAAAQGSADPATPGRAPAEDRAADAALPAGAEGRSGPLVIQVTSKTMGAGDDELGELLMRSFIKTQLELDQGPDTMIFYNSGVRLCCQGSDLVGDLRALESQGCEILACGTCLSFYELSRQLAVGRVTDMLEIAARLAEAAHIVRP